MSAMKNLTGQRFGLLLVHERLACAKRTTWVCNCDCGKTVRVRSTNLLSGNSKSCGCMRTENARRVSTKHAMSNTPTWRSWRHMLRRCTDSSGNRSHRYVARGVRVDPRWFDFLTFLADMGMRPSLAHSLERKDNDGHYCAENCVWATDGEQANNRSSNRIIEFRHRTQTLAQWCKELSLNYGCVQARLNRGWSAEEAFTLPVRRIKKAGLI